MQLIPYLMFLNGNCDEALAFYGKAPGGQTGHVSRYSDAPGENTTGMAGDKIMHLHFALDGDTLFMASDRPSESSDSGNASLNFKDAVSMKAAYEAIQEGGKVNMPLQDTFWGATFGILADKYGVNRTFNYDKAKNRSIYFFAGTKTFRHFIY